MKKKQVNNYQLDSIEKVKKDKRIKKDNLQTNLIFDQDEKIDFPYLLNYIFDLFEFSSDFSLDIKEISDMFSCNFKNYCNLFSSNRKISYVSNIFFNEETFLNRQKSFLKRKTKRSENDFTSKKESFEYSSGCLLFMQLEMISSSNKIKDNENTKLKEIKDTNKNDIENYKSDEDEEEYNFTFMDKKLRKIIEKEKKQKLLNKKEEDFSQIDLYNNCFILDLNTQI